MKAKTLIAALVLTLVLGGAFAVEAMHPGKHHGPSGVMGPGLAGLKTLIELNLSDSQKSVILSIIEKYEKDREKTVSSLREARKNLRTALQADEVNEERIRDAYRQAVPIREEMLVMRARMMAELKTVLTPEQRQLLEERKTRKLQRLKGRLGPWLEDRND